MDIPFIPFGPQLIGRTEKALHALLVGQLSHFQLTEPEWVTLRLASRPRPGTPPGALVTTVADEARFDDAADLVDRLTARGLVADDALTADGTELVEQVQGLLTALTAPIWDDLPADDRAAAERLLNLVDSRARALLG